MGYLAWIAAICVLMISLSAASAVSGEIGDLKSLIMSYKDRLMDSNDLAFFLPHTALMWFPKTAMYS